jgi:hypothetical protein
MSLHTIVARPEGYAYAASAKDVSVVQGPLSVAPCQTLIVTIRKLYAEHTSLYAEWR